MKAIETCHRHFCALGQQHLIEDLKRIPAKRLRTCLEQLKRWPAELVQVLQQSWSERGRFAARSLSPCDATQVAAIPDVRANIGVIILAGGQGSRLGCSGPKGCFPLLGKSLFERHFEKLRNAKVPVGVMASRRNFKETARFLQKHEYFGLPHIRLFSQDTLPLLDDEGRFFWEEEGQIAEGADGNGSVFKAFVETGLYHYFSDRGVETIHILPVDNPLADPLDLALFSSHRAAKADISINCIRLENELEPMGRLVNAAGRLEIAEFAELTKEQKRLCRTANTGLLAIDMDFFYELSRKEFPLHWARRLAIQNGVQKMAWKGERFIIDALLFAKRPQAILSKRDDCYAPLKERGAIEAIERLLMEKERAHMLYSRP